MFIAYDVMQRGLVDLGHEVRHVRNVTDVDDPNKRHALGGANSGPHAPRGNAGA